MMLGSKQIIQYVLYSHGRTPLSVQERTLSVPPFYPNDKETYKRWMDSGAVFSESRVCSFRVSTLTRPPRKRENWVESTVESISPSDVASIRLELESRRGSVLYCILWKLDVYSSM